MAGKSTLMRQVALAVLQAQMGGFVPRAAARIGLCDRIFTRVGAGDNLARGESTFMVEMRETAQILRHATARSLIVLDEIGRGTSTYDGVSIAWAVAEHIHDADRRQDAVRHALPRAGGAGGPAPPRAERERRGARVERGGGLPAQAAGGGDQPLIRRRGGQAGGSAARRHRPRPRHPPDARGARGRGRDRRICRAPSFPVPPRLAWGSWACSPPQPGQRRRGRPRTRP